MGRAPCCDKAKVKRGPWSPEEDATLKSYIEHHGTAGNWIALPQKIGLKRCGKSCRLRWLNYLRPNLKHGSFSEDEDRIISTLYLTIGSRWSVIAAQLAGRTDNDIKNYWNTKLKKKLLGKHRKDQHYSRRGNINSTTTTTTTTTSCEIENTWPHLPIPQSPYNNCPHMPYSMSMSSSQDSLRNLLVKLGGRFSDHDHHLYHPTSHPPLPHDQDDDEFMNFQLPVPHAATTPAPSSTLQLPINYDEQQQQLTMLSSSAAAATHNNQFPLQYSSTSTTDDESLSHYLVQAAALDEHFSLQSHDPTSSLVLQGMDFSYPLIHHNITPPTPTTSSMLYPPLLASHYDSMPLIHFPFQHYSSS